MKKIEDVKILVVGDLMEDLMIFGSVKRISPEAPVPVVNVTRKTSTLGGAGNVIRNIASIGAKVSCFSQLGKDQVGKNIRKHLLKIGCDSQDIIKSNKIISTRKTRVMSEFREIQMLRYDEEMISSVYDKSLNKSFKFLSEDFDFIIISDYAKGMITKDVMNILLSMNIPIIVDPKPSNIYLYNGASVITPNEKEYQEILKTPNLPDIKYILNTVGKNGMYLYKTFSDINPTHIPTESIEVFNVSGAGDTVVAALSVCLAMGYSILDSAKISNQCSKYVVQQPGTSTVSKNFFKNLLN